MKSRSSSKLRLVRRFRTIRRRRLRPRLERLERRVRYVWTAPVRRSVAAQLGRLSRAVERAAEAAGRIAKAQTRLTHELQRLGEVPRQRPPVGGHGGGGVRVVPGSPGAALGLGVVAIGLAVGNTWLLDAHLLPPLATSGLPGSEQVANLWVATAFSTLALLLGLFHFALFAAGRSVGLRLLSAVAVVLLIGQGALQAGATIVAVAASVGDVTGHWAGIAALALLAGSCGLVPPVVAATGHAALDRLSRWSVTREERVAARASRSQERMTNRLDRSVREILESVAAVRGAGGVIPEDDVARLLLRPEPAPSVERLYNVLRRVAVSVERDRSATYTPPGTVALRYLVNLGALILWLLAAGAALTLAGPGTGAAEGLGPSGFVSAGLLAGMLATLVSGLVLRVILERPERRTAGATGAAALLLLALAASSLAMGLGPHAAAAAPIELDPLGAAALLNLLILTAALGSALLPEGVRAAGAFAAVLVVGSAWLAVGVADLVLDLADRVLVGSSRARARRRALARDDGSTTRQPAGPPLISALGGRSDPR